MLRRVSVFVFSLSIVSGLACSGRSSHGKPETTDTGGLGGMQAGDSGGSPSASGGAGDASGGVGGTSGGAGALPPGNAVPWGNINSQVPSWYGTQAAADVAANILYYQNSDGGWPKNVDMTNRTAERGTSTIDNKATTTQLTFLAKIFNTTQNTLYQDAFNAGLDYLLDAQYDNGGWPQVVDATDYKSHITFNDGAMTLVITLMDQIAKHDATYAFVDAARIERAASAVERGIDCILKCQVVRDGVKTGWCAQHDEVTLEPANARAYELVSLSGQEGAGVLSFLMTIPDPSPEVIEAVQGAVRWFDSTRILGIEVQKVTTPMEDVIVVENPAAPPIWARFYQIEDDVPFFCGRDGIKKYSLAEIEVERRTGYSWYSTNPTKTLAQYRAWQLKYSPDDDALPPTP
ncbi:MAG TPA: pectate lyase [Polyangiaceae bacterium]|nr:pectate lyase [Polyangiaceae bacterium]